MLRMYALECARQADMGVGHVRLLSLQALERSIAFERLARCKITHISTPRTSPHLEFSTMPLLQPESRSLLFSGTQQAASTPALPTNRCTAHHCQHTRARCTTGNETWSQHYSVPLKWIQRPSPQQKSRACRCRSLETRISALTRCSAKCLGPHQLPIDPLAGPAMHL